MTDRLPFRAAVLACAAILLAPAAHALGFGDVRANVVLGQTLNVAVPVNLAEGESLGSECARAEVTAGDNRLQSNVVRLRVTQGRDQSEAIIRIVTTIPIEEPVISVLVGAGCPTRVSRELTLLADPPLASPVVAPAPAAAAAPAASPSTAPAATAPAAQAAPPRRAQRPQAPARTARATAPDSTATARPSPAVAPRAADAPRRAQAAPQAPSPRPQTASRPRLQLDAGQVSTTPIAAEVAQAQASAVQAAQAALAAAEAAASAAERRLRDMDAELAKVRAEAKAQTEALLQLRAQIAQDQAQRKRQDIVVPVLAALAGLLAMAAVWLGWRLRQQPAAVAAAQHENWWERGSVSAAPSMSPEEDSRWRNSQLAPSRPAPLRPMPSAPAPFEATRASHTRAGALDSIIAPPTVPAPTAVTIPPVPPTRQDDAARAMSVDEQIDLEQQADFFIALGHDDAAIDLLMAHLRSTGGGTPLPFLKLLEIHRRRGDREAYERTRVRFNQRFNSVAPAWQADPKVGRMLEDYPSVIARLQRAWPMPLDAMAELEALLFRRGTGAELFDLPAYQEVLFLYQLARDIHNAERPPEAMDTDVDVLLPIAAATVAAPGTISLRPEFSDGEPLRLDLDLSTDDGAPKDTPEPQAPLRLEGDPPRDTGSGDLWDGAAEDRGDRL